MSEIDHLLDQFTRAYEGNAWHGPALREILEGVTPAQAAARPITDAHTIWEIVLHIVAWENATRKTLGGAPLHVDDKDNFPTLTDTSEAAWQHTLTTLHESHHALREAITQLAEESLDNTEVLDSTVPGRPYPLYKLLYGIIEHTLYHAGQIILLKKALRA